MYRFRHSEFGPAVELDRCIGCGVWFDNGEWEIIRAQLVRKVEGDKT